MLTLDALRKKHPSPTPRKPMRQTHRSYRETHVTDCGRHLDWCNNAWLRDDGFITIRDTGNEFKIIGDVAHLSGAARVSKALAITFAHRGF